MRLTRLNKKISSYPKKKFHQKTKSTSKNRFQEGHVECRLNLEGVQKFKMDNRGIDDLLDLKWSSEPLFKLARVHLNGQVAEWPAKPSVPDYSLELEADYTLVWGLEAGGQAG